MTFVVKVYPNGILGNYLKNLEINESAKFEGPLGQLEYKNYQIIKKGDIVAENVKKIGLVAGGSGITPLLQLMRYIHDENHQVKCVLVFSNKTESDILCHDILKDLQKTNENMIVYHNITREKNFENPGKDDAEYQYGRISTNRVLQTIGTDADFYYVCGPKGLRFAMGKTLFSDIGVNKEIVYGAKVEK